MKNIVFIIIASLLYSCTTYNHKNPYPNMEILRFDNYSAYEFRDSNSDKLIVIFDGSSYNSSLGFFNETKWMPVSMASQLVPLLRNNFSVLIPEKLSRKAGNNHFEDMDDRANYTADKLIECYSTIINSYLNVNNFSSIVLIGFSESAVLLPLICENIYKNELIKGIISYAGGGLSLSESMEILSISNATPENWKKAYMEMIELYHENNLQYPDSLIDGFNGMSFRWYNSIIKIRPFNMYQNINIPILFIHGKEDYIIPVESTKYLENNLTNKQFEYKYINNMGHIPSNYSQTIYLRKVITEWINNKD